MTGAWSAEALYRAPDLVRDAHEAFARAGATVLTANNYACTSFYLGLIGRHDKLQPMVRDAVRLAREGAAAAAVSNDKVANVPESAARSAPVLVAGSLPPLGESYRSDSLLSETEMSENCCGTQLRVGPCVEEAQGA